MEFLTLADFKALSNPSIESLQLVSPHNSKSTQVTTSKVTVAPGAEQPRHVHECSEQIWIAISGSGKLLLANGQSAEFNEGQVARFADGITHGFVNDSAAPFVYLSITSPPLDFSYAYTSEA